MQDQPTSWTASLGDREPEPGSQERVIVEVDAGDASCEAMLYRVPM